MSDNIFEKMTEEERALAWMCMILNRDKIIEKTEQWNESVNKSVKIRDLYKERTKHSDIEPVEMVDIDDKVNPWYGPNTLVITEKQVEELKNGKAIYFSDGEYAHVIVLDKVANGIRTYHKSVKRTNENSDIIDGLKLTKDLWEFDPATGDKVEPHMMNELDRTTYDAVCGALERLTPKKVGGDTARFVDLHNGAWEKVGGYKCPRCNVDVEYESRFCPDCGQALDWR